MPLQPILTLCKRITITVRRFRRASHIEHTKEQLFEERPIDKTRIGQTFFQIQHIPFHEKRTQEPKPIRFCPTGFSALCEHFGRMRPAVSLSLLSCRQHCCAAPVHGARKPSQTVRRHFKILPRKHDRHQGQHL